MPRFTLKVFFFLLLCLGTQIAKGQVSASFTADNTSGCAPLDVHFTNTSTGATSYSWDLGNGTPPVTSTDASTIYVSAGSYTVTLTASNGGVNSTYSLVINAYAPPTVIFSASPTSACPGSPITFTSTSIANAPGPMTYNWNFGDGNTSTSPGPVYAYTSPGNYNVTLFVTNSGGCVSSLSKPAYIHIFTPPVACFSAAPTTVCKAPATITFTNCTTGGGPFSYHWDFGDGNTSPSTSPAHTYTASGSYTVTLISTDGNGCKDTLVQPGYISVGSLAASFSILPLSTCLHQPTTFTNTSSAHISSQWYFGDGNTSSIENPVYTYTATGTYTVKLVVFNGTCYDSTTHTINILALPTGSFVSIPSEPCPPPINVTFNATVPGGTTVAWLFGDGTTGSGASFIKNYPTSVIDYVDMILTNSSGCKDTLQKIDTLYNLFINPTASPDEGCAPLSVSFSMYAYSVVYNTFTSNYDFFTYPYSISTYSWNFGDGSPTSSSPTPTHIYTAVGVFSASCTITTANGCTGSGSVTVSVAVPPVASFTMTPTHICADRKITFTSTSTGGIDTYAWNFGDGSVPPPPPGAPGEIHTYTTPGIFTASLSVSKFGCFSLSPYTLKDTVDSPNAVINYNYACIPDNEIDFRDYSLGDNAHLWQFGDGTTSTASNPVHDYASLTPFTVILTTYNIASGCRDTTYLPLNMARPTVTFAAYSGIVNLCRDQVDTFLASVTGSGAPATRYRWYDNGAPVDSTHQEFIYDLHVRGLHTMTLIITDSHGCFDTFSRANYVLVAKPIDSFNFTPTSGCGPISVNFTDLSTDVVGASINKYSWTFGDGASSVLTTPGVTHTYTTAGTYTIREIVTDNINYGCKDTLTSHTTLTVYKPVATFTAGSTSVCQNAGVHFNNTSIGIVSSLWFFGDGDTSTITSPVHAYTATGSYAVMLIVKESHGCVDTLTKSSFITVNPGPTASFYMNDSFAVCAPLNVSFVNTSTGASSYTWILGDGHTVTATSPSEPYLTPGLYTVLLIAKNLSGCTDTAYGHVNIFGYAGAFSYLPLSGCAPLGVHFTAVLSTVASIVWDFGDGVTSGVTVLDTISHTYLVPGAYLPKLILKDTSGCTSFSLGIDTIKVDSIIPGFTIIPNPVCENTGVSFNDSSYSYFSSDTAWLWTFSGGFTSTSSAPVHAYTASGTFPVTLQVTDRTGCTGTIIKNVTVNPSPPAITGLLAICQGTTSALTDATTGGTWLSASTSIATVGSGSGIVTGVSAGTAVITYTVPTGCLVTTTITIRPLPSIITGATGICNGLTTTLSDATTGGVWSSSNTSVATINSSSGFITSISLGTTTITYVLTGGCATTTTVDVTTSPTPILGTGTICIGSSVPLSDGASGGNWTSSNTSVAIIGSLTGIVAGIALGTSTITYSLGTGCTVYKTVTVIPIPAAIKGNSTVCAGLTFALSDATSGGAWSSSSTTIATVGSGTGIVTGITGGADTIIYTLISGCTAIKAVTVYASPAITGITNICLGATTILSDAALGGTWSSSNTSVATINSSSGLVKAIIAGTTIIKYVLPSGCIETTTFTVIPAPAVITGASSVCVGGYATLSDATTGGTWSSADLTEATIGLTSGLVSGISSGTVLISYSIGTGCTSISTIVVNPISPVTGTNTVCVGQTTKLADTTLGGTWSSNNTTIATVGVGSAVVTGITGGTATISYLLATGCFATYQVTVVPAPPAITGKASVCAGLITLLSDITTGGTWASGSTTIATIGATTGVVNGLSAGTSTIIYTLNGCPTTATVTVDPLPSAISGANGICLGATTTLSDVGGGTWLSDNTTVATIGLSSGVATGVSAGTANITYTLLTGCITSTTISVAPYPSAITGVYQVCVGLTTPLSDATIGGTWSSSNTFTASVDAGGIVTGLAGGTAIISYSAGCPAIQTVTVNPLPKTIIGNTSVCVGAVTALSDLSSGGTWSSSTGVATIGITSGIVSGITPGTSTVTYTLATGCLITTLVTVNPLPLAITGNTITCTTLSIQLSDATGSGNWSSSNTTIATVDPALGTVLGVSAGNAIITYTLPTGCIAITTVTITTFPTAILGNPDVCLFGTTVLNDAVTGGSWSSSNSSVATVGLTSGIVTGLSLSTAIITYSIAASCSTSVAVSVMPLPTIYTITGGGNFCAGGLGVHIGLSGSSVGTDYFLYKGGVIATGPLAGTGSALDFGLQTVGGSYTVNATNSYTGCSTGMSGTAIIIVDPTPIPVANFSTGVGDTVCSGTLTTFTATAINGGTLPVWVWNVNGVNVGLINTYSYVPANGDIVTVTLTSNMHCASPLTVSKSEKITVNTPQMPSITIAADPSDTICQGKTVTLTAATQYAGTAPVYAWMKNTTTAGTGPVFTYVADNGDIVYCSMTSNYPCVIAKTVASNSVVITVDSPVLPHIVIEAYPGANIGFGWTDTLVALVSNGGPQGPTYQWVINGIPVPGATSDTFISNKFNQIKNDSVTCVVTSSGLCSMTTHNWIYINETDVSVKQINAATGDITVLPNPNKGEFTIKGSLGSNNDEEVSLEITDLLGQVVYKNKVIAKGGNINERILLGNSLANSMYILTLHSGTENVVFHIVLER